MNIEEAAIAFVKAHKPDRIDEDFISEQYGSVAKYLEMENPNGVGDCGSQYMEISRLDSLSGHTEIIEWYAHEAFQIAYTPCQNRSEERQRITWSNTSLTLTSTGLLARH